jgi:glycerate kinase
LFRLGGVRVSGVDTCAAATELAGRIAQADLVITGEGSLDHQSLRGKVVSGVAQLGQTHARPVVVLAGRSLLGRQQAAAAGIDEVRTLEALAGSQEAALSAPFDTLMAVAASAARAWHDGG